VLTTTEFRSHWIDSAGRCYAQRHPYRAGLQPVINLDEVRAWLTLSTSREMRRIGFPGGDDDSRVFYARQFLREDQHETEVERLAPPICEELTDDVQRYSILPNDWRTPFVAMRERWPLPELGGLSELRNLTPHKITVGEFHVDPTGTIARAIEEPSMAEPIRVLFFEHPQLSAVGMVPTSTTRYTGLVDLPEPTPGIYLIVSLVVAQVAVDRGRWTGDLLTPGQQVRDAAGRVIGCKSLQRCRP